MIRYVATLTVALVATLAVPTFAASSIVKVPDKFDNLAEVTEETGIPVLLPPRINTLGIKPTKIFGNGGAIEGGYGLELGVGKKCNGSNACYVAGFYAQKPGEIFYRSKVKLDGGLTGYYKKSTCGASCSPYAIQWQLDGVTYEIQLKAVTEKKAKATLTKLANQAIKAGPRE